MASELNKLNIEFVEHMGYYIPKNDVEGFDPNTYFVGRILMKMEFALTKPVNI